MQTLKRCSVKIIGLRITNTVSVSRLLLLIALMASLIRLPTTPPLWWDEGWTLTVARNWVQTGHYGRFLAGAPISARLTAAPPVVLPVALSFRIFGVGAWQARLPGVLFTLATFALMYYLAGRLYDRTVAIGTMAVLLLMTPQEWLHPVLTGRQVLGEMPALFYLLAGYACFISAWHRPLYLVPLMVGFWSIALRSKLQILPFWAASLLIPLLVVLYRRRWKSAGLLVIGLLGSIMVSQLLAWLQQSLLRGHTVAASPIRGLYDVTALAPVASVRLAALIVTLTFGLPTLLGLCHAIWRFNEDRDEGVQDPDLQVVRLALLTLTGSWFAWYVLLSVGWLRYLFPATFIGSIFVAALLSDLTNHFSLSSTLRHSTRIFRHFSRQSAGALLAVLLIAMTLPATLKMLYRSYVVQADVSVFQAADFLNTRTASNALIETYDSELFFLLDRPYHYPPDQIHVELNRRTFLGQDVPINYDPLAADPDYLVVGPISRMWDLYREVLEGNHFALLGVIGHYEVYQRQRSAVSSE